MKIEYRLPLRRGRTPRMFQVEPPSGSSDRPPRIARLVALAHRLEHLVQHGKVPGYLELAKLGYVSPSRLSQILILAQLAPAIQERILQMQSWEANLISERELREIAREVLWDRQIAKFDKYLRYRSL